MAIMPAAVSAARPQLIRAMNAQFLLGHIRDHGPCSRADLARLSGLSKPTVSLALAAVEQAGLIREAGQRIGRPGRSALLYEIRPEAGFVLGGGIGQAPGFAAEVTRELQAMAPVMPEVRVSALGTEAVVDGCVAAGADLAWAQLTAAVPAIGGDGQYAGGPDGGPGSGP